MYEYKEVKYIHYIKRRHRLLDTDWHRVWSMGTEYANRCAWRALQLCYEDTEM